VASKLNWSVVSDTGLLWSAGTR